MVSFSAHKNGIPQGNFPSYLAGDPIFDGSERKVLMPYLEWECGCYDTSLSRWTPPCGKYRISSHFGNDGTNVLVGSYLHVWLYKNGVRFKAIGITRAIQESASVYVAGSVVVDANGSDYFELWSSMNGVPGTYLNNNGIARDHYWQGA